MILPAVLVRRGKYSVADPLFVEERRPVLVARNCAARREAGDIVLVNAREKNRSLRGEVTRVIGPPTTRVKVFTPRQAVPGRFPAQGGRRSRSSRRQGPGRAQGPSPPPYRHHRRDGREGLRRCHLRRAGGGRIQALGTYRRRDPTTSSQAALDEQAAYRATRISASARSRRCSPSASPTTCAPGPHVERAAVTVEMEVAPTAR